jgi:hypothetical protein
MTSVTRNNYSVGSHRSRLSFFATRSCSKGGAAKDVTRNSRLEWGAREVIGIDLSVAVETAFPATRSLPNAHIIQADIYHLPLARKFDYAFSVGRTASLAESATGVFVPSLESETWRAFVGVDLRRREQRVDHAFVNPVRERSRRASTGAPCCTCRRCRRRVCSSRRSLMYGPLNRRGSTLGQHLFYNDYLTAQSRRLAGASNTRSSFDHLVAPTAFYIPREEFERGGVT